MDAVKKVRVSRRIQEFMSGGGVWQDLQYGNDVSREEPGNVSMHRKVMEAPSRADDSVIVEMTFDEASALYVYAGACRAGAVDNVGWAPEDNLPDLRATSALMAKLEKLFGPDVAR